jgi:hypothetical protein
MKPKPKKAEAIARTRVILQLIRKYGRDATLAEVLKKMAEPKKQGRPKKYDAASMAFFGWLIVELERNKSLAGRRLTIEKACQNLIKKARERSGGSSLIPGWQILKKHHGRAKALARNNGRYRQMLGEELAEWRREEAEEGIELAHALFRPNPYICRLLNATSEAQFQKVVSEFIDEIEREREEFRDDKFWNDEIERELVDVWARGLEPDKSKGAKVQDGQLERSGELATFPGGAEEEPHQKDPER